MLDTRYWIKDKLNELYQVTSIICYYPRFCSRLRHEAQKTAAKRVVGVVLRRRHNHNYVEEQNRETSVAAMIFKPQ